MKENLRKNKGITLIALVITIIVLLILAGVTIAALTGENGLLNNSNKAVEEYSEAQVKEEVELAIADLTMAYHQGDDVQANETLSAYLQRKLNGYKTTSGATITSGANGKIVYTDKSGTTTNMTMDESGKVTVDKIISEIPKLTTANLTFTYTIDGTETSEETLTNKDVTVTVTPNIDIGNYELRTSKDGINWSSTTSQTFSSNGTMYAALYDGTNYGESAAKNITNIDKTSPVINSCTVTPTSDSVTVTIDASDESGIAEYYVHINGSGDKGGSSKQEATSENNTIIFTGLETGIEYNISVLVYDKAGNNSGFYYPENFTTVGDTTAPTISSVAVVSYSAGCTITVDASDSESGIAEYEYTVLVSNDPIGTTTPNVTSTSNMCNITGLVLGEEYRITVRVIDNQGNAAMAYKYFTVTSNYSYY